jgi:hypothetical protein
LNKALLTKIGWRLGESNTDWSKIIRAKYLTNTQFSYNLYNNDLPGGSKIWMNITKCRGLLKEGTKWVIGNGQAIRFWEDNWLDERPLVHNKFSRLMETLKREIGEKVANYIDREGRWKKVKSDNCPQERKLLLEELDELLKTYRIPCSTHEAPI